ncbi:hypothetical protein FPSE_05167 [Fusarium pseudograminearum CS3096]|uniref:CFEM domain-containing protein n=1 Tax=Fusarium pseudograminearum (strain CS3096) TaxID=1028729 RepID=K3VJU4_FUSPC|nr:hypothetical protein FPSE_05167 [Fusarium pseudograminearum CS3096]EKJ74699.1 hypothetical protein FPSE_05167 [Fusarium pseudograminearum CS3096]KAF0645374.1 hypothetical protein FPSE5266_05167 [Fusarium pseudograminearum]
MKYSVAFVALAAVAAQAQSLADVPKCAIPCLDKAIASETSCDKTDLACVCKDFSAVRSKATSCVIDECGTDVAINEVLPATENLCKNPPKESEPKSTAEEEKPTTAAATSTMVVVTTSAEVVETTAAATTTVAPIIPTTAAEEPATSTPAAATPTKGPEQANGAAGLKGLGALAMAAFAALAL